MASRNSEASGDQPDLHWHNSNDNLDAADQAQRCRRLAESVYSREVSDLLSSMAEGYERSASNKEAAR